MKAVRIIIFAKAPAAGLAKTRLIPQLGAQGAADLARRMLLYTIDEARAAQVGVVELCRTPLRHPIWGQLNIADDVEISDQGEGDLGKRLAAAAKRTDDADEAVLLIGTDCIQLSSVLLNAAAQALSEYDAIIHPATDGGYVLLGLRRFDAYVFTNIKWSTSIVAASTIARIMTLGWSFHQAQTLHDIDEPADLELLPTWGKHSNSL